ncbi:MAG: hypothetical protein ABI837_00795 [Acidobacteriota bacterium]
MNIENEGRDALYRSALGFCSRESTDQEQMGAESLFLVTTPLLALVMASARFLEVMSRPADSSHALPAQASVRCGAAFFELQFSVFNSAPDPC